MQIKADNVWSTRSTLHGVQTGLSLCRAPSWASKARTSFCSPMDIKTKPSRRTPVSLRSLSTTLQPKLLRVQNSERGRAANVHACGKAASGSCPRGPRGQGRAQARCPRQSSEGLGWTVREAVSSLSP